MEPLPGAAPVRPRRETLDRIRRVFVESLHINVNRDELAYEGKLDEAAGLDSVAVLEFIAALEKEFDITLEPEMLTIDIVRDLRQLGAYIEERCAQRRRVLENRR